MTSCIYNALCFLQEINRKGGGKHDAWIPAKWVKGQDDPAPLPPPNKRLFSFKCQRYAKGKIGGSGGGGDKKRVLFVSFIPKRSI